MRFLSGFLLGTCLLTSAAARAAVVSPVDFDAYATGSIAGQDGWLNDSSASQPVPSVYEDAFTINSGHNRVLKVDPTALSTNEFSGAYLPFGTDLYASGLKQIQLEFDQYRGTLNQTVFVLEAPGSLLDSSYLAYEYGLEANPALHPTGDVGDYGIPLTAGRWQHVKLLVDMDAQEVSASVDGLLPGQNPQHFDLGVPPVKQFRGIGFRVYGTNRGAPNGPNYFDNVSFSQVPEPSAAILLVSGVVPLALLRKRRAV